MSRSLLVREVAEEHFGLGVRAESSLTTLEAKGRAYRSGTKTLRGGLVIIII